ncbi:MAG TPA: NAD(P)-dependent oxidoreductase [Bacilli bacterium]|jgi:nucleoside-diphosphate-sugar epimerase|nr:NAD(P)-dependent oxidoreductase [Bacilli bacterium]HNY74791.1 NAD(P)-dependent oxidoreductase [Bacilli bacterium]HOH67958.1 NAD(P)-dependent oxidoreductase [Bacilli bacterium]HPY38783.1 NAD(P)-dependent oxidoreductase [Bacilli bacterium]HQC32921.1 NAD(P)-dependent oxidoreductase [Bacilli bacterium]
MKVFIVGGTGLIGSETARELISRGHQVTAIALPPLPKGALLPPEMNIEYGNYMELNDEQLKKHLSGMDALVFAAGVDERIEGPAPIYDFFKKYNIDALERLIKVAKEVGVKHVSICGSYFSYFAKKWPHLELTKHHPYIRSRIDQEKMALSYAEKGFDVSILELPYIFGAQPGRKPVWVFLVESIRKMKKSTLYTQGGTTMVTVKQVAQGIAGALETTSGGVAYPFGFYNYEWKDFLKIVHKHMGYPRERKVVTIPNFLFALQGAQINKAHKKKGTEGGLDMVKFTKLQTANLFIEPEEGALRLGVSEDDIDAAIGESVRLSLDILEAKTTDIVDMKG